MRNNRGFFFKVTRLSIILDYMEDTTTTAGKKIKGMIAEMLNLVDRGRLRTFKSGVFDADCITAATTSTEAVFSFTLEVTEVTS